MKRPIDTLRRIAIDALVAMGCFDKHLYGKPGETYKRLTTPEEREAMQELKSTDTEHDRWPLYIPEEEERKRESNYRRDQMIEESKK